MNLKISFLAIRPFKNDGNYIRQRISARRIESRDLFFVARNVLGSRANASSPSNLSLVCILLDPFLLLLFFCSFFLRERTRERIESRDKEEFPSFGAAGSKICDSRRVQLQPLHRKRIVSQQQEKIDSEIDLTNWVSCPRDEQVPIGYILYNRVEKLRQTSVNKSPSFRANRSTLSAPSVCVCTRVSVCMWWTNRGFSKLVSSFFSFSLFHKVH